MDKQSLSLRDKKILEFIRRHRISVLGISKSDGGVHSATLHYAHSEDSLNFLFITEKESRKCKSLLDSKDHSASLVIGFSEEEFVTLQMEGKIKIVTDKKELEEVWKVYIGKYPQSIKRKSDSEFGILRFTPEYWSYRDYKTDPVTVISS